MEVKSRPAVLHVDEELSSRTFSAVVDLNPQEALAQLGQQTFALLIVLSEASRRVLHGGVQA